MVAMRGASPGRALRPGGASPARHVTDDLEDDVFVKAIERSTVHKALRDARASLAEPSRPYTPLDRSLFQTSDPGGSRPSSSYAVEQLGFVRDTFGGSHRPESARSSRSSRASGNRYQPILEEEHDEAYRREGPADVLRLDEPSRRPSPVDSGDASSGSEELTPVNTASAAPTPQRREPFRPPKPPSGSGYPPTLGGSTPLRSSGGYAGASASKSSKRHSKKSASPSRRAPSPALPQEGDLSGEAWDASCEALVARLQSLTDPEERRQASTKQLQQLAAEVAELVAAMGNGGPRRQKLLPMLLRGVLGLLDSTKDETCLFRLGRSALLLLRVEAAVNGVSSSGVQAAYMNIAKVLFKYSKVEGHDADFLREGLLVPLLELLQSDASEANSNELRVYIVGVLKNVSINEGNQKVLVQSGAVPALFRLMNGENLQGGSKEAQLLIQIMATLRSLTGQGYKQFITDERLNDLTRIMALFPGNVELLTNVSRTLAKLTLHASACDAYEKNDAHVKQITRTLSAHADCAPLALRLSFVLGNLTAKSDRTRVVFAFDCEGISLAPHLLSKYWQKERVLSRAEVGQVKERSAAAVEVEEVLVKLVRLIANIAISASAGATIAACSAAVDPLLDMLGSKKIAESEELVLNVVAAITNLLFYDVPSNLLFSEENKTLLCRLFRPLLLESYNVEALIETARALGNLSRHADARRCMAEIRLDEILTILLDHDNRDLVFYVCGALVNLAADPVCTPRLTSACPLVQKLGRLLGDALPEDSGLQLVAVKVLTNLSLDPGASWPSFGIAEVREALQQLTEEPEEEDGPSEERHQLLELSRLLLARLGEVTEVAEEARPAEDAAERAAFGHSRASLGAASIGGEGRAEGGGEGFTCPAGSCGRKFTSEAKRAAHLERRHPDFNAG